MLSSWNWRNSGITSASSGTICTTSTSTRTVVRNRNRNRATATDGEQRQQPADEHRAERRPAASCAGTS